ncbi:MAG TPA: hypothetical protein PKA05_09130 [Roseiflexaceae bacterium]|nr:hypothetical protein [Roseiflexaceae bacterium]HMP40530.1 hypothetical protein [Roseiflexaceae bacterium]
MLIFRPIDTAAIAEILTWRYPPPYDRYHLIIPPDQVAQVTHYFLDPLYAYHRIDDENGSLVAFCCFGIDAQVAGGDYRSDALDLGLGVRPDLVGRGQGKVYTAAVIDFARTTFCPPALRVTIAAFNERAQRAWVANGMQLVSRFSAVDGLPFVILQAVCR